jgi:hypothetical protein
MLSGRFQAGRIVFERKDDLANLLWEFVGSAVTVELDFVVPSSGWSRADELCFPWAPESWAKRAESSERFLHGFGQRFGMA